MTEVHLAPEDGVAIDAAVLATVSAGAGTETGPEIEKQNAESVVVVANIGTLTAPDTCVVRLQHADATGGSFSTVLQDDGVTEVAATMSAAAGGLLKLRARGSRLKAFLKVTIQKTGVAANINFSAEMHRYGLKFADTDADLAAGFDSIL